jgi:hypothetical protein
MMDQNTLQAMTALAQKLGTTAEHLWGVLLRQAPISGAIDLAFMAALVVACIVWWRAVISKTTERKRTDDDRYPRAEWAEEGAFFAIASAVMLTLLTLILCAEGFTMAVAAFVNPEYWALRQIIG